MNYFGHKRKEKKRSQYAIRKLRIILKSLSRLRKRRKQIKKRLYYQRMEKRMKIARLIREGRWFTENIEPLYAPSDFRLLKNTKECADFFSKLLMMENIYYVTDACSEVKVDLTNVVQIDFASTLMLSVICKELAKKKCNVKEYHNKNDECFTYLKESGFFDRRYDAHGRLLLNPGNSQIMVFESGKVILADNIRKIIKIISQVGFHLNGEDIVNKTDYVGMIKEICGNSCEWGNKGKTEWTIGAKFEKDKVVFVALDLGQGILNSLFKSTKEAVQDLFASRGDEDVLVRVFEEYYGSRTKEDNRHQGLPFIKECNDNGSICDLQVVTNNVSVEFADLKKCKFTEKRTDFIGTLYSWRINKDCLNK